MPALTANLYIGLVFPFGFRQDSACGVAYRIKQNPCCVVRQERQEITR